MKRNGESRESDLCVSSLGGFKEEVLRNLHQGGNSFTTT